MYSGSFDPFQKAMGTVGFLPISLMDADDWEWLDFDNIRTVAQNRVASMLTRGQLRGFFDVNVFNKAAKPRYLWPATRAHERRWREDQTNHDFFVNEAEADADAQALQDLNTLRFRASWVPLSILALIVAEIAILLNEEDREQAARVTLQHLEDLRLEDAEILFLAVVLWALSLAEIEQLLIDIPEDEQEMRAFVEKYLNEIKRGRLVLAAGRGL